MAASRASLKLLTAVLIWHNGFANATAQTPPKELNVDQCVSIALERNPRVVSAAQRVLESEFRVTEKRGAKMPQLQFHTEALKYDWLPPNKQRILGGGSTDVYSALNASLLLFSSGKAESAIDAATARFLASQQYLRRTAQEVAFEVRKAYYLVLRLEALLEAREEAVRQMEHYLTVAREKEEIGKAPRLDVLRAEVQLADVEQARLLTVNQLKIARLELLNAMGIQDEDVAIHLKKDDSPAPSFTDAQAFLEEAIRSNPEYLRAQLVAKAAEREVTMARGEGGSSLSLVASYNKEGKDIPNITNWYVGLSFNLPVYTGGIVRARIAGAKAVSTQERSAADLARQRVTLAVRSAVLSTQDAAGRLAATSKSVRQAEEALTIAREKYTVGLGSATEVIDTQVALARARTNYAEALYDGKVAAATLDLAIGRDPIPALTAAPHVTRE